MLALDQARRLSPVHVVLGALLAGTALFLVPTLALAGFIAAAVFAAVLWLGGIALLWVLLRREAAEARRLLARERDAHARYRQLVENGAEAFVVVEPGGEVVFTSPNVARVVGVPPARLQENGGIMDLVVPGDRRRALRALAQVRTEPGTTVSVEVRAWHPDGTERFLDVRATNLVDAPQVDGILISLRDITPRKAFETEIQHLAYYDALTGLANRRFFFEQGGLAVATARRNGEPLAVLYIDLDRFKQVNDLLGHEAGDDLLGRVAETIRRSVRDSDIPARLGGDEFAVVLADVGDVEAAARVAHRILRALPASALGGGHEVAVSASIGVAMFPDDADDLENLLQAADASMYRAKTQEVGVQFYRPELRDALTGQLRLEREMRLAMEQHELHLHYQPVFDLSTGTMVGAEALSRWRHLTRGMVAASEFIRLAERAGLIRSLDRWAIGRAMQQRDNLLDDGWAGWVAVNLSPSSVTDPGLAAYVRQTIREAGVEPGCLVLELPEDAVLRDVEAAADLMWELKDAGAAVAIDDFGATSFGHLKRLPIDILKLHPEFIGGIGRDPDDERLVRGALTIARGIRARVLAKGVERDDQVAWLRDTGCDFIQGYLMGGPVPVEDLKGDAGRQRAKN